MAVHALGPCSQSTSPGISTKIAVAYKPRILLYLPVLLSVFFFFFFFHLFYPFISQLSPSKPGRCLCLFVCSMPSGRTLILQYTESIIRELCARQEFLTYAPLCVTHPLPFSAIIIITTTAVASSSSSSPSLLAFTALMLVLARYKGLDTLLWQYIFYMVSKIKFIYL